MRVYDGLEQREVKWASSLCFPFLPCDSFAVNKWWDLWFHSSDCQVAFAKGLKVSLWSIRVPQRKQTIEVKLVQIRKNSRHLLRSGGFYATICAFNASIYAGNVFVYVQNSGTRWQFRLYMDLIMSELLIHVLKVNIWGIVGFISNIISQLLIL